jgi:hypothetical protein
LLNSVCVFLWREMLQSCSLKVNTREMGSRPIIVPSGYLRYFSSSVIKSFCLNDLRFQIKIFPKMLKTNKTGHFYSILLITRQFYTVRIEKKTWLNSSPLFLRKSRQQFLLKRHCTYFLYPILLVSLICILICQK